MRIYGVCNQKDILKDVIKNDFIYTEHKGVEYNNDVLRPNQEAHLYRANLYE